MPVSRSTPSRKDGPAESSAAHDTFSFQLIGQRGVGKTVFLAAMGAHIEQFDEIGLKSADPQTERQLAQVLQFIRTRGIYPPATDRTIPFNFDLYRGRRRICRFRWEDLPGETCQLWDEGFNRSTKRSSGGLLFVDGHALLNDPGYRRNLDELTELLLPIVNLVKLNGLHYPLALVLTKCDLIAPLTPELKDVLRQRLSPVRRCLERHRSRYEIFYSSLALVNDGPGRPARLVVGDGQSALLWLIEEIQSRRQLPALARLSRWLGLGRRTPPGLLQQI